MQAQAEKQAEALRHFLETRPASAFETETGHA
jgi:hypothetical protein